MEKKELFKKLDKLGIKYDKRRNVEELMGIYIKALEDTNKSIENVKQKSKGEKRVDVYKKLAKLVRVRIQCKDPSMSNIDADKVVVFNDYASITAVFPTNTDSYYIPAGAIEPIRRKQFTMLKKLTKPEKIGGLTKTHEFKTLNTYHVEELEHISKEELQRVQKVIIANGGTNNGSR